MCLSYSDGSCVGNERPGSQETSSEGSRHILAAATGDSGSILECTRSHSAERSEVINRLSSESQPTTTHPVLGAGGLLDFHSVPCMWNSLAASQTNKQRMPSARREFLELRSSIV